MRLLYTFIFYLALPLVLARLWWRGRKAPAYRQRWWQRLGFVPRQHNKPLWIHAVSVGETIAIAPLVEKLLAEQPELPILLTNMTPTGAARVQAMFGDRLQQAYCPYDLPDMLARFLKRVQPRACIVVETELWPNMVAACAKRNVPVLLANARLSERSARGYRKFSALTQPMLQRLTCVAAQNATDGGRFVELGLPEAALNITGSIKFDISPPAGLTERAQTLRDQWGADRPVLIGASTHEGEDAQLLSIFETLRVQFNDLLLVLVPRHPERFDQVALQAQATGLNCVRRSANIAPDRQTDIYIGDTMGELMQLYAAADIAFVGGSLVERGGHNPLEPAALGKPVLMGPHLFNFAEIAGRLEEAGGLTRVDDQAGLVLAVEALLAKPQARQQQGEAAQLFVAANRGALGRLYQLVSRLTV